MANFFFKYFVRKNWRGWRWNTELFLKNGAIDGYVYQPCYLLPGRIYIALGPWHLRDFRNIFLPNIGENQKKSYDFSSGPPAGTASYCGKPGPD